MPTARRPESDTRRAVKLPFPEPYSGTRGKADVFVDCMEAYFKFSFPEATDEEKIELASFQLKDAARSWFKGAPSGSFPTWSSFKEQLVSRFALHNAVNHYSDALYNLRQLATPISLHDQQFENLILELSSVGMRLSEDEAFQRYRQSLNDFYRDKLAEYPDVKTYRSAFEKLEAIPPPSSGNKNTLEASRVLTQMPSPHGNRFRMRRGARMGRPEYAFYGPAIGPVRSISKRPFPFQSPRTDAGAPAAPRLPQPQANAGNARTLESVKCFRCKQSGHYAKDCPTRFDIARQAQ
jgi:hypothetical protein